MSDDLIKRLHKYAPDSIDGYLRGPALEAAATIARQQALLDRALEASFADKERADRAEEEVARLREALADLEDEIDNSAIEFERPTFVEVCEGIIRAALTPKP